MNFCVALTGLGFIILLIRGSPTKAQTCSWPLEPILESPPLLIAEVMLRIIKLEIIMTLLLSALSLQCLLAQASGELIFSSNMANVMPEDSCSSLLNPYRSLLQGLLVCSRVFLGTLHCSYLRYAYMKSFYANTTKNTQTSINLCPTMYLYMKATVMKMDMHQNMHT